MSQTIRVLIADDHYVIRASLSRILESQEDFLIVGQAAEGAAAVEMANTLHPDVVLMDYEMPEKDGVKATQEILQSHPDIVVIGFSMYDDGPVEKAMLDAGAAVHLSKTRSAADLLPAIRRLSSPGDVGQSASSREP